MISSILARLLNLPALFSYLRAHRSDRSVHDPADDLELALYGAIFGNDFLHYGYFDPPDRDPEYLSLADLKRAMDDYASLLVARVSPGQRVLDIGCGMGGLLARLDEIGVLATGLTPNRGHAAHIATNWPHICLLQSTLEALGPDAVPDASFDAAVNAESFQYVALDAGMQRVRRLLKPGGRWIVLDYYRLHAATRNRSGHLLADFEAALPRHGFTVAERVDVTENVLPSLAYGRMLATRFGLPLARFSTEKFLLGRPFLAYLLGEQVRTKLAGVKLDMLEPDVFRRDKKYLLFTLVPG
jgi:ubiquinone/menaquinone biosynthesis C-methylase UbiE